MTTENKIFGIITAAIVVVVGGFALATLLLVSTVANVIEKLLGVVR